MRQMQVCVCLLLLFAFASALPVKQPNKQDSKEQQQHKQGEQPDVETALEYERYLKEVVEALESDPDFRKKLDKAPEADIRSGKIAQELDYVNHHVRTKLDEIKRREIERLRSLANKEYELSNDIDRDHLKVPQHLDHGNEHTFEIEDLRKLIKKTSEDLAEADRQRRAEFKEYEMQKEFERESKLKELNEEERKKFEQELKEKQQKHKKHDKVHHPGNKAQLEEVWEKQDQMDKKDFDPHTFFMIHDVDGNGFWDENEVKALFVKELDKVYQQGLPEDDMRERAEEMERMREHVFKETDVNHDNLISFQEFLEQTKRDEFRKDPEWETVDEQPQYTHEEYLEFEKRRQEEINRLVQQGVLPPHPNMPQGYYPNGEHAAYQQQHGQPVQLHPNQAYHAVPQQPNQYPQQPVHQQYQAGPPQQQYQPQQQQYQPQQQQQQPQQVPIQQYQPQQQQYQPQQQQQQYQPPQQVPVQQQNQQQQYQQQVPVQQQQPIQQQPQQQQQYQQVPQQPLPVQNQQQQQQPPPVQQQQPQASAVNNQQPQQQQQAVPIQQQQQQQQHIPPKH